MKKMSLEQAYMRVQKDSLFAFLYDDGHIEPVYDLHAPWNENNVHLLPGSFNPLHIAHESMHAAIDKKDSFVAYEMSMERIDKEFLDIEELDSRLNQFHGKGKVFVNRWPYFIQKAGILRNWNLTFHIGIDTAIRLVEAHGVAGIQGIHADFHIYDRIWDNRQQGLDNCMVFSNRTPLNFHKGITPNMALMGLSSTAIRAGIQDREGHLLEK